jgi:hypothetical protein
MGLVRIFHHQDTESLSVPNSLQIDDVKRYRPVRDFSRTGRYIVSNIIPHTVGGMPTRSLGMSYT